VLVTGAKEGVLASHPSTGHGSLGGGLTGAGGGGVVAQPASQHTAKIDK